MVPSRRACTDINGSGTVKSPCSKPLTTPVNPGWPNPSCTPGKQLCCVKVLRSPCPRPVRHSHWTGRQELATMVFKSCSQCSKSQQISQREDWSFLLSSFSTSTQQINFHHAKRRQCPKAGLSTPPRADHCRTRDLSQHTEKSHLPPIPYLLPELWLADPPVVCVTFNKIILPPGLLEATKCGSTNHAFPSW